MDHPIALKNGFLGFAVGIGAFAVTINQLDPTAWWLAWWIGMAALVAIAWEASEAVRQPDADRVAIARLLTRIVAAPTWHGAYDQFRRTLLARLDRWFGPRLLSLQAFVACLLIAFFYPLIAFFVAWAGGAVTAMLIRLAFVSHHAQGLLATAKDDLTVTERLEVWARLAAPPALLWSLTLALAWGASRSGAAATGLSEGIKALLWGAAEVGAGLGAGMAGLLSGR